MVSPILMNLNDKRFAVAKMKQCDCQLNYEYVQFRWSILIKNNVDLTFNEHFHS